MEPAAIQTATAYAYNEEPAARWPLLVDQPKDKAQIASTPDAICQSGDAIDISRYWGNLSPWYSVPSSAYGLPDASPPAPSGCSITQTHILYRHGARYPTDDAAPPVFAQKIYNATKSGKGVGFEGDLAFLNEWTYKLGAEYLTPFGRLQEFELGLGFRQQYGYLLNNFTAQGKLPVFRTESQDRMVKTAQNFAAGFFGVPEFLDQVELLITVEAKVSPVPLRCLSRRFRPAPCSHLPAWGVYAAPASQLPFCRMPPHSALVSSTTCSLLLLLLPPLLTTLLYDESFPLAASCLLPVPAAGHEAGTR